MAPEDSDTPATGQSDPGAVDYRTAPPEVRGSFAYDGSTWSRAKRVLVVDDDPGSRRALERVLRALNYQVEVAQDGVEALAKLRLNIDLVVLDAAMPHMDGFAVAEKIRGNPDWFDLPIIMITGLDRREDQLRAIEVGINDFIRKPFDITELRLRSGWLLKLKEAHDALKGHRAELERTVEERTAALRIALEDIAEAQRRTYRAHIDTIRRLVLAAEYKDFDTAMHIERIGLYCELLGRALNLAPHRVEILRYAAPMHDVGKIGVPDAILVKAGKLSPEEWKVMQQHTLIGARILSGSPSELLQVGEVIALSHHERWDGKGYPHGRRGEDIPLEGRLCAVADVFDALTTDRPYRTALPTSKALQMMRDERGKHFDPDVLDTFFQCVPQVEEIRDRVRDSDPPREVRPA